jgi:hypothetical protein
VPPRGSVAARDRGMEVLEQKLSILTQGPSRTRRNPALDVLTGRVPDERLASLQATLLTARIAPPTEMVANNPAASSAQDSAPAPAARPSTGPTAMVLPVAAIRMAAVARSTRPAPSPWLKPSSSEPPTLKLIAPPPSRWARIPLIGSWLERLIMERQSYRWTAHSPRARLAS